jgi:hypothetical protein
LYWFSCRPRYLNEEITGTFAGKTTGPMFIKNQTFTDEETLLELLFDFGLGESSDYIKELVAGIDKDLAANDAYQKYYESLQDEDDRVELYTEERDLRLAEILMQQFEKFVVDKRTLYGVSGEARTLLFSIDLT